MADKKETYPYVFKLKKPIQLGENTVEEIRYREPVGRDMHDIFVKDTGEIAIGGMAKLFGKICDQPSQVVDLFSAPDYMRVVQICSDFLGAGQ